MAIQDRCVACKDPRWPCGRDVEGTLHVSNSVAATGCGLVAEGLTMMFMMDARPPTKEGKLAIFTAGKL